MGRPCTRLLGKVVGSFKQGVEYENNELSIVGFKNMVKKWLKTKKSKLKTRFLKGKTNRLINIELCAMGEVDDFL
jgi:hypothetical protein